MEDNNILDLETSLRIKLLMDEIQKYKDENTRLLILLKEAGVEEAGLSKISDEEVICIQQITKLREQSEDNELDKDQVKNFDILHRNLKIARGEGTRVGRKSSTDGLSADQLKDIAKK